MPDPVQFHFVDVFADRPFSGNPVVLVEPAVGLNETEMRSLAREFNQSETTFLLPATDPTATARLRSFTPNGSEVDGAGHNALGAWWWWAAHRWADLTGPVHLWQEIGGAVLPVDVTREGGRVRVTMTQGPPEFGAVVSNLTALAAALGLTESDLNQSLPPRVVSTGAGHLHVALTDRHTVDRVAPDAGRLAPVLTSIGAEGCYVYSLDPVDPGSAVAYARFFNPVMGISEDPATGTAAGPLVALLVAAGRVPAAMSVVVEQGYAIGRPSRIEVLVDGDLVRISGSGVLSASGTLAPW